MYLSIYIYSPRLPCFDFFLPSAAQTMHDSNGVATSWTTRVSPAALSSFRGYDVATLITFSTVR